MITDVWHSLGRRRLQRTEAAITQRYVEQQIGDGGEKVKREHAHHTGKICYRNERDLGRERKWNVKPSAAHPCFGSVDRPKRAGQRGKDRATHHKKKLAMQMSVFVAENKKKRLREEAGAADNEQAENAHAA